MHIVLEIGIDLIKNFRFDTICYITQEPQKLQKGGFIGTSAVIKYHQYCGEKL